mgnify:CR=1 FL=1
MTGARRIASPQALADGEVTPKTIAILPLGATEQHGPHLPPETDWLIAEGICDRLIARIGDSLDIVMLPAERIGYSVEHIGFPRTQSFPYDEAIDRWIGIGEALADRGVRKLLLLNAHGGNSPLLTIVAQELRARRAMLAVVTHWLRFGVPAEIMDEAERHLDIHAGRIETSVMLALHPDKVDMAKARDFPSLQARMIAGYAHLRAYGAHAFGWMMGDINPDGAAGNAAGADAETGERLLGHAVDGLAVLLEDMARFAGFGADAETSD